MKRSIFWAALAALGLSGCIRNDIPYPRIRALFTRFEVEGQLAASTIDTVGLTVRLTLDETADARHLPVKAIEYSSGATSSHRFGEQIDLSAPLTVTLSIYQDWVWTVTADQPIERRFEVEGQIGTAVFDAASHRAIAYVSDEVDLDGIRITALKLGPRDITQMAPAAAELTDFTRPQQVTLRYHDCEEVWTLYVVQSETIVSIRSTDVWTRVAWLAASGLAGAENGFRYRKAGSTEWTEVPRSAIIVNGGDFSTRLIHLEPATSYDLFAYSGAEQTPVVRFTTDAATPLENGSLDAWNKSGKQWNPWAEGGTAFWDTGNKGATTLGESNSTPSSETPDGSGQSAALSTQFIGVIGIGKLAAGNLFVGRYLRTDGTNGVLNLGRPFTERPTAVRMWYRYHPVPITHVADEFKSAGFEGKIDTCHVYFAVGDWDEPVEIRTKPSERKLFDRNDPHIIAYGSFQTSATVAEWTQVEVPLEYRATDRKPTLLVIVASASKYGDYFTGGDGTQLDLDEFELQYDYTE